MPEAGTVNVGADPFLTQSDIGDSQGHAMDNLAGPAVEAPDLKNDPFWTHTDKSKRQPNEPVGPPGEHKKERWTVYVLVYVPWLIFVWILLMWLFLKHWAPAVTVILTILIFLVCSFFIGVGQVAPRYGSLSYTTLGGLCLLAAICGLWVGAEGWSNTMRQYWWMRTGEEFRISTAASPAAARADASWVGFWDDAAGQTLGATAVDSTKSAGFHQDGQMYCAAPILNPTMADQGFNRVEYWAVGMNCCANVGSFTCDASRQWDGGYAVVLLGGAHGGGLPCSMCNNDKFRAAVDKAEAVHGLVSSQGALYVRWVKSADDFRSGLMWDAIAMVIVSAILAFIILGGLGYVCWQYNIGVPGQVTRPGYRDTRAKRTV